MNSQTIQLYSFSQYQKNNVNYSDYGPIHFKTLTNFNTFWI